MDHGDIETLNIVQQVLKHLLLAIATSSEADIGKVGTFLEAASANERLDPAAREMLADLAAGATGISARGVRRQ